MRLPWPKSRRGVWTLSLAIAFVAAAAGGAHWYDRNWPWHHFRTVAPGRFYRAGQPSAANVHTAVHDYGVKTIVNLRDTKEWQGAWYRAEVDATAAEGAMHVDVPLVASTPPSPEQIEQLLKIFEDPARAPVLVHCEYGSVRSAAIEALYRIEVLGETNEQAAARIEHWGYDFAKTDPKIEGFVRSYVPRRAKKG